MCGFFNIVYCTRGGAKSKAGAGGRRAKEPRREGTTAPCSRGISAPADSSGGVNSPRRPAAAPGSAPGRRRAPCPSRPARPERTARRVLPKNPKKCKPAGQRHAGMRAPAPAYLQQRIPGRAQRKHGQRLPARGPEQSNHPAVVCGGARKSMLQDGVRARRETGRPYRPLRAGLHGQSRARFPCAWAQ